MSTHQPKPIWRLGTIAFCAVSCLSLQAGAYDEMAFDKLLQSILQESCVKCHGAKEKIKGDVDLTKLSSTKHLLKQPELLQEMIDVLDFNEIPPEEEEPVPTDIRHTLITQLNRIYSESRNAQTAIPKTTHSIASRSIPAMGIRAVPDLQGSFGTVKAPQMRAPLAEYQLSLGYEPTFTCRQPQTPIETALTPQV